MMNRAPRGAGRACLTVMVVSASLGSAAAAALPAPKISAVFDREGTIYGDRVVRYGWPRSDLRVRIGDVDVPPGVALGSWAGFTLTNDGRGLLMGDLVLIESEVDAVMRELRAQGIRITGVHNHLAGETPRVVYVHYEGVGDSVKLAEGLKAALEKTATPRNRPPPPPTVAGPPPWVGEVQSALARRGAYRGGVLGFMVARADEIKMNGEAILPAMGVASQVNFASVGDGRVATSGDFALIASEVDPVIAALHAHHIEVTAVHSHMLDEEPRLLFVHWWAVGKPDAVARGLMAALVRSNYEKVK
ncbi:MAG: DUF1259 domain-containing protein [Candidatus Binataceae bacterium]